MTLMNTKGLPLCLASLTFATLASCGVPEAPVVAADPQADVQPVLRAQSGGLSVTLLTTRPLAVGLNRILYAVTRDGSPVTQANVVQKPLMNMTTMKHSCPLVNPPGSTNQQGLFEGLVVFTMPSSAEETWDLGVEVSLPGESAVTSVKFERLLVADSPARKALVIGGAMHVVTLTLDGAAKVGTNKYFVTVHQPVLPERMSFIPRSDLSLSATPEMPSMGHGSSGNVNPSHQGAGVYQGSVNFSMLGDWVIHLVLADQNGVQLGALDWTFML
jgi:photosystem II stability/assembly factor-like uncharacterized protein